MQYREIGKLGRRGIKEKKGSCWLYKVSKKNIPQFLFNFGFKHARGLVHNSYERWYLHFWMEYKNIYSHKARETGTNHCHNFWGCNHFKVIFNFKLILIVKVIFILWFLILFMQNFSSRSWLIWVLINKN